MEAAAATAPAASGAATATARRAETQEGGGAGRRGRRDPVQRLGLRDAGLRRSIQKDPRPERGKVSPSAKLYSSRGFSGLRYPRRFSNFYLASGHLVKMHIPIEAVRDEVRDTVFLRSSG